MGVGRGGDLPVVFGAEHMVALLNRHQRFDGAMRGGGEHSGGRGVEAEEEGTLDSVSGWRGGRGRDGRCSLRPLISKCLLLRIASLLHLLL